MRREVFCLALVAVVMGLSGVDRVQAQQLIDPAPVDEEPEAASELPLPDQSLLVQQPARDNSRAFFGVTFEPEARDAAVARSVSAGSPADQAGVRAGDAIVSVNGREVGAYDDVLRTIAALKPGDVLDVEISRRVSVRARAVLDGAPIGLEHTSGYRAEAESLPSPAGYEVQAPVLRAPANQIPPNRAPANVNAPRPRPNNAAPQNRNTNVNRSSNGNQHANNASQRNNSNDRNQDNRGRSGVFRGRR